MPHLPGSGELKRVTPGRVGKGHRSVTAGIQKLPDILAAVDNPTAPGEDAAIGGLAHIVVLEAAGIRFPVDGMVLVVELGVQRRLDRRARIVGLDHRGVIHAPRMMPGLDQVEVQPNVGVEVLRKGASALRMERDQMTAFIPFVKSFGQRPEGRRCGWVR